MSAGPVDRHDVPSCLAAHRTRISACETARSTAIGVGHDRAEKAAADAAGATFSSLNGVVCSYDPCPVVAGNVVMWRDQTHMTATFSALLAPSFATVASGLLTPAAQTVAEASAPPDAGQPAVVPAAVDSDGDGLTDAYETSRK